MRRDACASDPRRRSIISGAHHHRKAALNPEAADMTTRFSRAVGAGAIGTTALAALISATVAATTVPTTVAASEPLVSQGIGAASCERLAADINPAEGLGNPFNLALLAWVQGYVSAANIALLEDDSKHVDMSTLDATKVLTLVQAFCKANPDKKPVAAIDDLIRSSEKIKTMWEPGTVEWDE
jgi:hypothetical protein